MLFEKLFCSEKYSFHGTAYSTTVPEQESTTKCYSLPKRRSRFIPTPTASKVMESPPVSSGEKMSSTEQQDNLGTNGRWKAQSLDPCRSSQWNVPGKDALSWLSNSERQETMESQL